MSVLRISVFRRNLALWVQWMAVFVSFVLARASFAAQSGPAPLTQSAILHAFSMSTIAYTDFLCGDKQVYSACYSISYDDCTSKTTSAILECVRSLEKSPREVITEEDAKNLRYHLIECITEKAGIATELKKPSKSDACRVASENTRKRFLDLLAGNKLPKAYTKDLEGISAKLPLFVKRARSLLNARYDAYKTMDWDGYSQYLGTYAKGWKDLSTELSKDPSSFALARDLEHKMSAICRDFEIAANAEIEARSNQVPYKQVEYKKAIDGLEKFAQSFVSE